MKNTFHRRCQTCGPSSVLVAIRLFQSSSEALILISVVLEILFHLSEPVLARFRPAYPIHSPLTPEDELVLEQMGAR